MGRKKRRAIRSQTPTPAVVVDAKGGQNDEEDATDVVHAEDATDVVPITSTRKNTNKKQRRNEYNQLDPDTNSPNDESFPQSPIRSSWFAEVKWISRHNHHDHQSHQTALQNTEGTSMPTNIISTKVKDATITPKEDSPPSSSLSSSHTPNESNPLPTNNAHDSLLSELNKLKQQLMPTAKICADAINTNNKNYQTNSNKTTTTTTTNPGYEFRRARSICNPYECLGETFSKNRSKNHRNKKNNKKRNYCRQQQSSSGLSQFVNRSAIKLANVDALLGFCLTSTSSKNTARRQHQEHPRNSKVSAHPDETNNNNNNFVFVDLCGGPGGFSEYILYRHVHHATLPDNDQGGTKTDNRRHDCSSTDDDGGIQSCYGFGMSLSGSNDDGKGVPWDLDHLKQYHLHFNNNNKTSDTRNSDVNEKMCYHVCNGVDNTGSIYNWDNVLQLQRDILTTVPPGKRGDIIHSGSHNAPPLANLVVADGGFDAQRDSNNQEAVAHKIIVSQTAAALTLLRSGGIFVLKMFGFREEGTRRMLRYMYGCFDKMTFVKPILSRPASAERYLVCHGYSGPEMGWDGLIWRERMMMVLPPSAVISRKEETASREYAPLEELMDSFDLDMLQLNIDTCTSIINYLGDKSAAQGEDGTSGHGKRIHNLDLKVYEAAWQLF